MPNVTDLGRYRSLCRQTDTLNLNGTLNRPLRQRFGAPSTRASTTDSESRFGLPSLDADAARHQSLFAFLAGRHPVPLRRFAGGRCCRESETATAHGGLTLDGNLGRWRWTFTANYDLRPQRHPDRHQSRSGRDPGRGSTPAIRRSIRSARSTPSLLVMRPAGPVGIDQRIGRRAGGVQRLAASSCRRAGDDQPHRCQGNTLGLEQRDAARRRRHRSAISAATAAPCSGSFDLPITSRRDGFGGKIGDISLNLNFEVEHLSDFGTMRTLGYGVRWSPIDMLDLARHDHRRGWRAEHLSSSAIRPSSRPMSASSISPAARPLT